MKDKLPPKYLRKSMPKRVTKKTFAEQLLREDWGFLRTMIAPLHVNQKQAVKRQYRIEFVRAYNAEPLIQRKANAGRRSANLYLFQHYEKRNRPAR